MRGVTGKNKKLVICQFCGNKTCQDCCSRKRAFPKQPLFEGSRPQMGECCILCDRKFYMKEFHSHQQDLRSKHNEIDQIMVDMRQRGAHAIQLQNENNQLQSRYNQLIDEFLEVKDLKQEEMMNKRDKIDEIIELAARTENSIATENTQLITFINSVNQGKQEMAALQTENEVLEKQLAQEKIKREKARAEFEKKEQERMKQYTLQSQDTNKLADTQEIAIGKQDVEESGDVEVEQYDGYRSESIAT